MRKGQIDGFCVGEPWSSVAVTVGVGCIVMPTTAIWPLSPEKVLGCRCEMGRRDPDRLDALVRALYNAALWCEQPANHAELARMLAAARYVGAPARSLQNALVNRLSLAGAPPVTIPEFYLLASHHATFPWVSHALWFYSQMLRWRQVEAAVATVASCDVRIGPTCIGARWRRSNVEHSVRRYEDRALLRRGRVPS